MLDMDIHNSDVKLVESQRPTEEEDGGGPVTGNCVIDGNVNNFPHDISRIDRTVGDVALRNALIGISTTGNSDTCLRGCRKSLFLALLTRVHFLSTAPGGPMWHFIIQAAFKPNKL